MSGSNISEKYHLPARECFCRLVILSNRKIFSKDNVGGGEMVLIEFYLCLVHCRHAACSPPYKNRDVWSSSRRQESPNILCKSVQ